MHPIHLFILLFCFALTACGGSKTTPTDVTKKDTPETKPVVTDDVPNRTIEVDPALTAVLALKHRDPKNVARDAHRHPAETLAFFGAKPEMHIVEVWPGGGWYTEVLAAYVKGKGKLTLANVSLEGKRAKYRVKLDEKLSANPEIFGEVETVVFEPPANITPGDEGSADLVVTFRNGHSFTNEDALPALMSGAFRILKPGGVLGVVQHRANEGADPKVSAKTGYVPEAYMIETAKAAGFELEATSEINANPKDTKDHPEGVWTLPPSLRLGDVDKEKWMAIGESDRMTLKFRKPL